MAKRKGKVEYVEVELLKANPNNPRKIDEAELQKLMRSMREFPEMLEARPIVVNADMVVLGGNQRLKAAREIGLEKVPVYVATWDEVKNRRFIVQDNISAGEWDIQLLQLEWDVQELADFGMPDLSALDNLPLADDYAADSDTDVSDGPYKPVEHTNDTELEAAGSTEDDVDTEESEHEEVETVTCPHCNETFEIL